MAAPYPSRERSHKIANIRKDTLHKLTSYLAKNHSRIGIENPYVSGMMANHKLAKAIQDMGFHEFKRQLEYKCQLHGSTLIVVDRIPHSFPLHPPCRSPAGNDMGGWIGKRSGAQPYPSRERSHWYPSTKTCNRCHTEKDSMPLSERVFRCNNCGLEIDRNFNASINLEIAAS